MTRIIAATSAAVLLAVLAVLDLSSFGIVRAQGPVADSGPAGRALFAPELSRLAGDGTACVCHGWRSTGPEVCACTPPLAPLEQSARHAGVRVQNLGDRPTRVAVAYHSSSEPSGSAGRCDTCTFVGLTCSPVVDPGRGWTFPHVWMGVDVTTPVTPTGAAAMSVFSLSVEKVADLDPEWGDLAERLGLPADAAMADLVCDPAPIPGDCEAYRTFHEAFLRVDGEFPGSGLPVGPLRGEPIVGTVTVIGTGDSADKPTLDRYTAVPLAEILPAVDQESPSTSAGGDLTYVAPGGYGYTLDGYHSGVAVQNTTTSCATVALTANRSHHGPDRHVETILVPPNGVARVEARDVWPDLIEMAAYRMSSDVPLAATLSTVNYATSVTSSARRERAAATRWFLPRAYQETRPVSVDGGRLLDHIALHGLVAGFASPPAIRSASRASDLADADGWESIVAIFNPGVVAREAVMRMQASGEPSAEVLYPVEPLAQVALQPGFRLGLAGGPGWMEVESTHLPPFVTAVESLRAAPNVEGLTVEAWSASAVPGESGVPLARTIGLPELGGPAVGDLKRSHVITSTATTTDTLLTRVSIQNPYSQTARVAIDSYAPGCGFVGSEARTIDPRQTVVIEGGELPGARYGGNSAVLRVIEGGAAAFVETSRSERLPATVNDPPIDVTNAYYAPSWVEPVIGPTVVTATLGVTPTRLAYELGDLRRFEADISVSDVLTTGRCLSYVATSDVDWLTVKDDVGPIPGHLTVVVDGGQIVGSAVSVGTITIAANEPNVNGSPVAVEVEVRSFREAQVHLPYAGRSG